MKNEKLSRRDFLKLATAAVGSIITACAKLPTTNPTEVVVDSAPTPTPESPTAVPTQVVLEPASGGPLSPEQQVLWEIDPVIQYKKKAALDFWKYWAEAKTPVVSKDWLVDPTKLPLEPVFDPSDPLNVDKALLRINVRNEYAPGQWADAMALPILVNGGNGVTQLVKPNEYREGEVEAGMSYLPITNQGNDGITNWTLSARNGRWVRREQVVGATDVGRVLEIVDDRGAWQSIRPERTGDGVNIKIPEEMAEKVNYIRKAPDGVEQAWSIRPDLLNEVKSDLLPTIDQTLDTGFLMMFRIPEESNWIIAPMGFLLEPVRKENDVWIHENGGGSGSWKYYDVKKGEVVKEGEYSISMLNAQTPKDEVQEISKMILEATKTAAIPGEASMWAQGFGDAGREIKQGRSTVMMEQVWLSIFNSKTAPRDQWENQGIDNSNIGFFKSGLLSRSEVDLNIPLPYSWGKSAKVRSLGPVDAKSVKLFSATGQEYQNNPFVKAVVDTLTQTGNFMSGWVDPTVNRYGAVVHQGTLIFVGATIRGNPYNSESNSVGQIMDVNGNYNEEVMTAWWNNFWGMVEQMPESTIKNVDTVRAVVDKPGLDAVGGASIMPIPYNEFQYKTCFSNGGCGYPTIWTKPTEDLTEEEVLFVRNLD